MAKENNTKNYSEILVKTFIAALIMHELFTLTAPNLSDNFSVDLDSPSSFSGGFGYLINSATTSIVIPFIPSVIIDS